MSETTLHGMLERWRNLSAYGVGEQVSSEKVVQFDCADALQPIADQLQAVVERMKVKTPCRENYLCALADLIAIIGEKR